MLWNVFVCGCGCVCVSYARYACLRCGCRHRQHHRRHRSSPSIVFVGMECSKETIIRTDFCTILHKYWLRTVKYSSSNTCLYRCRTYSVDDTRTRALVCVQNALMCMLLLSIAVDDMLNASNLSLVCL